MHNSYFNKKLDYHSSVIHNSPKLETTEMPINMRMTEQCKQCNKQWNTYTKTVWGNFTNTVLNERSQAQRLGTT